MRRIAVWLLIAALLISGCANRQAAGAVPLKELLQTAAVSLEEGHFFFAGKVLRVSELPRRITYYEGVAEKSTFYRVQVTDDYYGCLPARELTLCVLGTGENFSSRMALQKGSEYLFDATLWVDETEAVFLLPTFYTALPERKGDLLFRTDTVGLMSAGTYEAYRAGLAELAEQAGYSASTVAAAAAERLALAQTRDLAFFEALSDSSVTAEELEKTASTAARLLERIQNAATWQAIREALT